MNTRLRSTTLRVAAALAATALVVASCGSDDAPSPAGPTDAGPTEGPVDPTDGPVDPTVAPVEPTDAGPTEGPTEPPQRDDGLDDVRAGIYAWADAGDTENPQVMDCPLTSTHDWQSVLHESGHPQVQIGDVEVEFASDDNITTVTCTGSTTPGDGEVGVEFIVLADTYLLELLLGEVAELLTPGGPGPEGLGGDIMVACADECFGIWYLEDIMVITTLGTEGAETGHIAEITRTLVPGLLDAAEQAG